MLLVNILLSEEDRQALQKEPFRNSCVSRMQDFWLIIQILHMSFKYVL